MIVVYVPTFPELSVTTNQITATTRKLKTKWSLESAEDLKAMSYLDKNLEKELAAQFKAPVDHQEINFKQLTNCLENKFPTNNKETKMHMVLQEIQNFIDDTYDSSCDASMIYGVLKEVGIIVEKEYEIEE